MLLCERPTPQDIATPNREVRHRPQVQQKKDGGVYLVVGTPLGPMACRVSGTGWDWIRAKYPYDSYPEPAHIPITYEDFWELQRLGEVHDTTEADVEPNATEGDSRRWWWALAGVKPILASTIKPAILITLAGFFLLAAAALHAYVTPVPVACKDEIAWVQYGRLYFFNHDGKIETP